MASPLPSSPHEHTHGHPHQHSHPDVSTSASQPVLPEGVDTVCAGCKNIIDHNNGSVVVAFGASVFHMDCFRCSKCQERVVADTNLLLLSDGNPVCSNCSYQCFVCKKPIMDEAIMTGDESYHAACFTCRHCSKKIEELVFAKTSAGIYCMACHNERVARSRRHADARKRQKRKEEEKRDREFSQLQGQQSMSSSSSGYVDSPSSYSLGMPSPTATTPNTNNGPDYFPDMASPGSSALSPRPARSPSAQGGSLSPHDRDRDENRRNFGAGLTSPQPSSTSPSLSVTPRTNTLPLPPASPSGLPPRRGSVDDSKSDRQESAATGNGHASSVSMGSGVGLGLGLGVPQTSKADRRRSINPSTFPAQAASDGVDPNTSSSSDGRSTALPPSPLRTTFDPQQLNLDRSPSPSPASATSTTAPLHLSSKSRTRSRDEGRGSGRGSPTAPPPRTTSLSSLPDSMTSPSLTVNGSLPNGPVSPRGGTFLAAGADLSHRSASPRHREASARSGHPSPDQAHFPHSSIRPEDKALPRSPSSAAFPNLSGPSSSRGSPDDRRPSDAFNASFGFENDPPRSSISSERGTSPTKAFLDTPRQRTASAVSVDPPRLGAHRPVSFLLANDPAFASMFESGDGSTKDKAASAIEGEQGGLPTTPSTASTIQENGSGAPAVLDGRVRVRQPSEDGDDPDVTISGVEFPSSGITASSSSTSDRPLTSSTSGNLSPSSTSGDLSGSSARMRMDSQASITGLLSEDGGETLKLLKALVEATKEKGETEATVSVENLEVLIAEASKGREKYLNLKNKYDAGKRMSARYIEGLTVASDDFEKERSARAEAESEVKRLRAQMHDKNSRLSLMDADVKRQDSIQRRSTELSQSMQTLERKVSKLRVERDLTLAEVEELSSSSKSGTLLEAAHSSTATGNQSSLSRSLSTRLESVKEQYREDIEPLAAERERLLREINDLKETRETYVEEATTLVARNDELHDLQSSLMRQVDTAQDALERAQRAANPTGGPGSFGRTGSGPYPGGPSGTHRSPHQPYHMHPANSSSISLSSMPTSGTLHEPPEEVAKYVKVVKPETMEPAPAVRKFKWYKSSKGPESGPMATGGHAGGNPSISKPISAPVPIVNGKGGKVLYDQSMGGPGAGAMGAMIGGASGVGGMGGVPMGSSGREHAFINHNIPTLRFTKCDHCGDKMWGPIQELRCAGCGTNCHTKCAPHYDRPCHGSSTVTPSMEEAPSDAGPSQPSMFGRDLTEQAEADREAIPVIVRKCIAAVDAVGMEYEGIYRKTGGSSGVKHITHLFERGDYDAFDLSDSDTFNDISCVTSVLKNYFRVLPDPLLTFRLHEQFVSAATIRDPEAKRAALLALVRQLPKPHFDTLRYLMMHLNRVMALKSENLMSAKNLGVVFGPTLMRSADRSREFGDMAGKALAIDWLVENAEQAFNQ